MSENEPNLDNFEPSWSVDGYDIIGEQRDFQDEDNLDWDTRATSNDGMDIFNASGPASLGCLGTAGDPPSSGTYVLGSIGGECQWISTTEC